MNLDTTHTPIDAYIYVASLRNLSPLSYDIPEPVKFYRVPVKIENGLHTVYVADDHVRMFDADTLPDFVRHKLAMIVVKDWGNLPDDNILSTLDLFAARDGDMHTIGWKASDSYYIVVMTTSELMSLRGGY